MVKISKIEFYLILFILTFPLSAWQDKKEKVEFIVKPYILNLTDSSFHVHWETNIPSRGMVKFGVAGFNVLEPDLNIIKETSGEDFFHNMEINNLRKDETYFYQVVSFGKNNDTVKGPLTPVYIPDNKKAPISFCVIGDTQNSPERVGTLSSWIYQEHPQFIIHVGDLTQHGPIKRYWPEHLFNPMEEILRFYPLYPVLGNHENNHELYYRYFSSLPDLKWFYTVKKGDVLFIFADTNKDILTGSYQYQLLEKTLAEASEKWKIVVHHHPVYVSEIGFYGDTRFRKVPHGDPNEMHLKTLYEKYGVNLVLNGHAHFYERTWPIFRNKVNFDKGVVYVTSGGGCSGDMSVFAANKSWYDARTRRTNHFLYIIVSDEEIEGRAIDDKGRVFDTWKIGNKKRPELLPPLSDVVWPCFLGTTTVNLSNPNAKGRIAYRLGDAADYQIAEGKSVPVAIHESARLSYRIINGSDTSWSIDRYMEKLSLFPSVKRATKGVTADYYEGVWAKLPDFDAIKPVKTFHIDSVSLYPLQPRVEDGFAVRFKGCLDIPETAVYRFWMESFDGSKLFIDGRELIDNDGIHYEINKEGFVALEKGTHAFEVRFFNYVYRETLNLQIYRQGEKIPVPFDKWVIR